MERYQVHEGVIVNRLSFPNGDLLLRLVSPEGTLQAVARKVHRPGGRSARLSLFHHVRYQSYHRPASDLPTLTQVELLFRLEGLSAPGRYPCASFLGELAYALSSPESAEGIWPIFTSGLRGIATQDEPRIPLLWSAWRVIAAAGLAPRLESRCGHSGEMLELNGGLACTSCATASSVYLGMAGVQSLVDILSRPGQEAVQTLAAAPIDRLMRALLRHSQVHVGGLKSVALLEQVRF